MLCNIIKFPCLSILSHRNILQRYVVHQSLIPALLLSTSPNFLLLSEIHFLFNTKHRGLLDTAIVVFTYVEPLERRWQNQFMAVIRRKLDCSQVAPQRSNSFMARDTTTVQDFQKIPFHSAQLNNNWVIFFLPNAAIGKFVNRKCAVNVNDRIQWQSYLYFKFWLKHGVEHTSFSNKKKNQTFPPSQIFYELALYVFLSDWLVHIHELRNWTIVTEISTNF